MSFSCAQSKFKVEQVKQKIENIIAEVDNVTVAVAFEDLKTGDHFFINEKIQMHAASTMKTPVMIEVFKQAEEGRFNLSDSVEIKNEFKSIVDGSIFSLDFEDDSDDVVYQRIGQKMSILDLVTQMITVSSNFATNILIELVGAEDVMKTMKSIEAENIQVLRGVEDMKAYNQGLNNTTDAFDLYLVMKVIAQRKVVSEKSCNQMIAILSQQQFREKIPRYLPPAIQVANKTGRITGIDHDSAIIYLTSSHAYVLVVLTQGFDDHQAAQDVIATISEIIYNAMADAYL